MTASVRARAMAEPSVDTAADSATTRLASFRWPTPPYAAYPCALEQTNAEDCILTSHRGRNVVGKLAFFDPDQGSLEFQFRRATSAETIPFGDIKMLCLAAPLRLECNGTVLAALGPGADARPQPQKFVVEFAGGDALEGQTLGHVREPFGVFLFRCLDSASDEAVEVERVFVPQQSIRNFSVGECLGQCVGVPGAFQDDHDVFHDNSPRSNRRLDRKMSPSAPCAGSTARGLGEPIDQIGSNLNAKRSPRRAKGRPRSSPEE